MSIFIGYDARQPVAFHVAAQSIINHAKRPLSISPLIIETLPITRQGLTPFTFSRYLVPWLCGYEGRAVFMDSDFMARADVGELFSAPDGPAVSVVSHPERKFERPSLMVFDCAKCRILTPEYVQKAPTNELFGLRWADGIGELPPEWNHLVGYDAPRPDARLAHFTQGLPCFDETRDSEHGEEWRSIASQCVSSASWQALMGSSVHAAHIHARRT